MQVYLSAFTSPETTIGPKLPSATRAGPPDSEVHATVFRTIGLPPSLQGSMIITTADASEGMTVRIAGAVGAVATKNDLPVSTGVQPGSMPSLPDALSPQHFGTFAAIAHVPEIAVTAFS